MTEKYLKFFHFNEEEIEDRFIKFFELKTLVNGTRLNPKYPLHLEIRGDDQSNDIYYQSKIINGNNNDNGIFGNLDIIQQKSYEKDNMIYPYRKLATYYLTFGHLEGFYDLLKSEKFAHDYRLLLKSHPLENEKKSHLHLNLYIDRKQLLEIYEKATIPSLINKILSNPEFLVEKPADCLPSDEELTRLNTDVTPYLGVNYLRKPFPHQAKNMQWMVNQENRVDLNFLESSTYLPDGDIEGRYIAAIEEFLYYNRQSGHILNPETLSKFSANIKGGVLADDIGLGKTMSMIGLIAERKRGGMIGQSLVICPNRLCKQWHEEINLSVGKYLNPIIIGTITQFHRYLKSSSKFDVVIVSYNFLTNDNYLTYLRNDDETEPRINLLQCDWARVILDEGHEYLKKVTPKRYQLNASEKAIITIRDELLKVKSKYYWICSGTPYRDRTDVYYLLKFITGGDFNVTENEILENRYDRFLLEVYRNIFRKNTKDKVENQINIPLPIIRTEFLKMSRLERSMYNSVQGDQEKMIQYCNHILVSEDYTSVLGNEPLTLEQIHQKMTDHFKILVEKLEKRISRSNEERDKLLVNRYDNLTKISDLEEKIRLTNSDLVAAKTKFNIFNSINSRVEEYSNCPICYNDIGPEVGSGITVCGHLFCAECLNSVFDTGSKCPVCRYSLNKKDVNIMRPKTEEDLKEKDDKDEKINKYGTKMAHLLKYLERVLAISYNRVIVFSQYDSLLRLVKKTLEEFDINCTVFNGSISMITGRIRQFKIDNSIRVALMSSEKAPSGLNLTEANHIVLLDTLNTDSNSARVIEEQAIGRAVRIGQKYRVEVQRFVMLDTIEHEYYLRNLGVDHQEEKFDDEIIDIADEQTSITTNNPVSNKTTKSIAVVFPSQLLDDAIIEDDIIENNPQELILEETILG